MKNKEQIAKIWDVLDSLNIDVLQNKQAIIKLENEREQNSHIETTELTGDDLCRAMLARGDTRVMCEVYDDGNRNNLTHVIRGYIDDKFHTKANSWKYATPINNQGEPLTANDVGL